MLKTSGDAMPVKIMIANRGEIAIRIAKTLLENGYMPVGIYTKSDSNSLHRRFLVEDREVSSYLNISEIVEAAVDMGAEAIHPGYGFLSENPEFAREVLKNGLIFIGPPPNIMAMAGDKIASKIFAERLEVPTLPWIEAKDFDEVLEFAKIHGYPLIIKAAGGGGGRGVRIVYNEKELKKSLEVARKEAEIAFADPRLFVEPYIPISKHIEVQILGDGDNIVHLFERECSIQRRFQKIIEEAPSPSLFDNERNKLYNYAVEMAERLRYRNAGTIEFVFDLRRREFYFMEINTRIQVEHPVTEMITGIDIVKKQVEIALYGVLDIKQGSILRHGHSIEVRIYSENPITGEPSKGKITSYHEPSGPGIRVDSGVCDGSTISGEYDPMIAKLIVWSPDRWKALERLRNALAEFRIEGVSTNIPLLRQIISTEEFVNATYTTRFFDEKREMFVNKLLNEALIHSLTAVALVEFGEKGVKNYLKKYPLLHRIRSSERIDMAKRHAWYYYNVVKDLADRISRRSSKRFGKNTGQ